MIKKNIIIANFAIIMLVVVAVIIGVATVRCSGNETENQIENNIDSVQVQDTLSHWEMVTLAIIMVESGGDVRAVNGNCVGCMQITPIYVAEVNRITGKCYTLDDRWDVQASVDMFNDMNYHYNHERTLEQACRVHNPHGGRRYYEKVKEEYEKLKDNQIK